MSLQLRHHIEDNTVLAIEAPLGRHPRDTGGRDIGQMRDRLKAHVTTTPRLVQLHSEGATDAHLRPFVDHGVRALPPSTMELAIPSCRSSWDGDNSKRHGIDRRLALRSNSSNYQAQVTTT
jgi:hypothetical protein